MTRPRKWFTLLSGTALLFAACPSTAGEAAPGRGDPAARLSPAPEATEYWNLTARFDGGYRLFAWFGITNEGPGKRMAGALWYLVHPDGRVSEFRNARGQGRWKLSPDHLRIDVASSSLDLRAPVRRLALDTTSQGAKINLEFPAGETPAWPAPRSSAKFRSDTLQISAPTEGTIWVRGMPAPVAVRGTTALTHAWMDEGVSHVVQRYIEFVASTPDLTVYLSDITTPAGEHRRWLAVERRGAIGYQTTDFELVLGQRGPATADRKYPVPGRLLVRDGRMTLDIRPGRLLLRTNPLDPVPQPFRFLFSLKVEPQWIWADASFHVALAADGEGAPIATDGRGILGVIFVNPMPLRN